MVGDIPLKESFGRTSPRKRKEPPTQETGGSKKSRSKEDEKEDEKKAEGSAVGDPLDTFANVWEM